MTMNVSVTIAKILFLMLRPRMKSNVQDLFRWPMIVMNLSWRVQLPHPSTISLLAFSRWIRWRPVLSTVHPTPATHSWRNLPMTMWRSISFITRSQLRTNQPCRPSTKWISKVCRWITTVMRRQQRVKNRAMEPIGKSVWSLRRTSLLTNLLFRSSVPTISTNHLRKGKSTLSSGSVFYVDVAYIPYHGNEHYVDSEFFRRIRARYYVLNAVEISRLTLESLLEGKQQWDKQEQIPVRSSTFSRSVLVELVSGHTGSDIRRWSTSTVLRAEQSSSGWVEY